MIYWAVLNEDMTKDIASSKDFAIKPANSKDVAIKTRNN
jgi:hypothetical protein